MRLKRWLTLFLVLASLVGCETRASSGDRVLVSKGAYDTGTGTPQRYDVVVFKYPRQPMKGNTPTNYIKRLLGLPGELLAIFFGRVYRWTPQPGDEPPFNDEHVKASDRWQSENLHIGQKNQWLIDGDDHHDGKARGFEILRKPPHVMLAMRRIVYDNDYQAADLKGRLDRWVPHAKSEWKASTDKTFSFESKDADRVDWLRYQHLLRPDAGMGIGDVKPSLIFDLIDYNSFRNEDGQRSDAPHWVGDLMLECEVNVAESKGEFWFELNRGAFRYQARFDLSSGDCTLFGGRTNAKELKELDRRPTRVKGPGAYSVRFANIDARLTVWVDRDLPFGDGHAYDSPDIRNPNERTLTRAELDERRGPTENDLKQPASVGAKGARVTISHLKLWRDTYYTTSTSGPDYHIDRSALTDPSRWKNIREARETTMYVQPGHYFCLGDNSQASSDSRDWGAVPQRLMLGRALVVYFPLERVGPIR